MEDARVDASLAFEVAQIVVIHGLVELPSFFFRVRWSVEERVIPIDHEHTAVSKKEVVVDFIFSWYDALEAFDQILAKLPIGVFVLFVFLKNLMELLQLSEGVFECSLLRFPPYF